jgi:hypothetical protein
MSKRLHQFGNMSKKKNSDEVKHSIFFVPLSNQNEIIPRPYRPRGKPAYKTLKITKKRIILSFSLFTKKTEGENRPRGSIFQNWIRTQNRFFVLEMSVSRTKAVLNMGAIKKSRSVRTKGKESLFVQLFSAVRVQGPYERALNLNPSCV